jgi:predicted membrane protein
MDYDRSELRFRRRHRSAAQGVVGGAVVVVVGLLLLLNNMHIIRVRDFWDFWPLILVVFGLARIVESRTPASLVWGGLVASAGGVLFLENLNLVTLDFSFIWPLVLIAFGLTLLWKALDRQRLLASGGADTSSPSSSSSLAAVFSGGKRRMTTPDFRGLDVLALFGGFEVDLRESRIEVDQAVIDVNAMFGGVKLLVPYNWTVTVKGFGMFGAFEDKTVPPRADPGSKPQHLVVTGVSIFGGTVVQN